MYLIRVICKTLEILKPQNKRNTRSGTNSTHLIIGKLSSNSLQLHATPTLLFCKTMFRHLNTPYTPVNKIIIARSVHSDARHGTRWWITMYNRKHIHIWQLNNKLTTTKKILRMYKLEARVLLFLPTPPHRHCKE